MYTSGFSDPGLSFTTLSLVNFLKLGINFLSIPQSINY